MKESDDPYWRLRECPTPPDEICACTDSPPFLLFQTFGRNPIHCLVCNREVAPERAGISRGLADKLANWHSFRSAFETLWLDSGEFEDWARDQLTDPSSPSNVRGLAVVRELNSYRSAYMLWFQDNTADDFQPLTVCPVCHIALRSQGRVAVCDACRIAVSD